MLLNRGDKVLILGSGGLRIGQAGEFDYSGSQAIKAFKEEGLYTLLINPNIATVQTDRSMADQVYFLPLDLPTVSAILAQERPRAIYLSVGGQTALNLGISLYKEGILDRYNVQVLGTPIPFVILAEGRSSFKECVATIGIATAASYAVTSVEAALEAAHDIGYPIMVRSGYSLGGKDSFCIRHRDQLQQIASRVLTTNGETLLIEKYLEGYKEVEYEVVRDCFGNAVAVCNMENIDPLGIHTGDSAVVAPSQTLTDREYHTLRRASLEVAAAFQVIGECNVQYALSPKTGEWCAIEMNPRLSRSSALASKATGYPLAFIAAKLALGHPLDTLTNQVTGHTSAFFEPALDYVVVKLPRWDMQKFKEAESSIGSEMKSVGEVMAIGRSFCEALQKGIRGLAIGAEGIEAPKVPPSNDEHALAIPSDQRLFALYAFFSRGGTVARAQELTHIDPWFLEHIAALAAMEKTIRTTEQPNYTLLLEAKQAGFSDSSLAQMWQLAGGADEIRSLRKQWGIFPRVKQIDTLAGEFPAATNYLYMTYNGSVDDLSPSSSAHLVVGSGPYCIGSSVEFDWCAVNALRVLRERGKTTIMVNSNPETVSTDYDESDRLYFEEITLERLLDIIEWEEISAVIVSFGGQLANNLALSLAEHGVPLMGTPARSIDLAENRNSFSSLLSSLKIDQPDWIHATSEREVLSFSHRAGYPILIRPSYVLSGAAMNVASDEVELLAHWRTAQLTSPGQPVVLSRFIANAKEIEVDGVAYDGQLLIEAISEHVEHAGVHSGDATLVLPPQKLYLETLRRVLRTGRAIARALAITGPFNIQLLAKDNDLYVIECNLRGARSLPFVSKATNCNFVEVAVDAMLGRPTYPNIDALDLDYVAVKAPLFSYSRIKGANPIASVEMTSTGEVACFGKSVEEAFYLAWRAAGNELCGRRLLISTAECFLDRFYTPLSELQRNGWTLYATPSTHDFLVKKGIASICLFEASDAEEPSVAQALDQRWVDLVINIPKPHADRGRNNGYWIRRHAVDRQLPLVTDAQVALLLFRCLAANSCEPIEVMSWQRYTDPHSALLSHTELTTGHLTNFSQNSLLTPSMGLDDDVSQMPLQAFASPLCSH